MWGFVEFFFNIHHVNSMQIHDKIIVYAILLLSLSVTVMFPCDIVVFIITVSDKNETCVYNNIYT